MNAKRVMGVMVRGAQTFRYVMERTETGTHPLAEKKDSSRVSPRVHKHYSQTSL